MLKIIKKTGTALSAWRLGDPEPVLEQLIARGRIRRRGQVWEVFSREAAAGSTGHGQEAQTGDYIKLDSGGWPYPNGAAWFLANHRHIEGDRYEQLPHPLDAWTADEPLCPEVEFLIREKGLLLRPELHPLC